MTRSYLQQLHNVGIIGLPQTLLTKERIAELLAMDAAMTTAPNNAVPELLTAYIDPEVIKILHAPTNAEKIFSPVKKGALGVRTVVFPVVEETGDIAQYSDYGSEGASDYNANYPERNEYIFQSVSRWGDLESTVMSMAQIDAANSKQRATAATIKRGHNRIWFFGMAGMKNYGILNDPSLPAPIAPVVVGAAITWADKGADAIYDDIAVSLYGQLVEQMQGLETNGLDMSSPLKLCYSNKTAKYLKKKNSFGLSVHAMLLESFPNMQFVSAPEYSTTAGELVQLICVTVQGQQTGMLGYTEMLHAHGVCRELSSYKEKKSAGNLGAVIKQPFAVAQMIGV